MQQVELFAVATILWGGIAAFLLWLFFRMNKIESTMKKLSSAILED